MRILAVFTGDKQRVLSLRNTDSRRQYLLPYTLHGPEAPGLLEKTMGLGH